MSARIYYFTGTGNSLWAARRIAERLEDTTLTPMVRALAEGDLEPEEERIGLVFPVYMYRMPHLVRRFIDALRVRRPVFVVATCGGAVGDLFEGVERALAARGASLEAGMSLPIQSNYVPFGGAPGEEELAAKLERAEERLERIAGVLSAGEGEVERTSNWFRAKVHPGALYALGHKFAPQTDKKYLVDDTCDGCGICALVCPVDNLVMADERPTWQHRCEQCMACMQWCPQESIQVGDKTRGARRYHHPSVRSADIVKQKPRPKGEGA